MLQPVIKKAFTFMLPFAGVLFFASCEKTEEIVINYHHNYYPGDSGSFIIYDVDSIVFNDFTNTVDTFRFQRKYVVDSSFIDNSGRLAQRLIRYMRADDTQPWKLTDVWYFVKTQNTLEVVESNQRFVKLVFPPFTGLTWKGNRHITITTDNEYLKDWNYQVTAFDVPDAVGGLQFDSTLTVLQHNDENIIEKVFATEKYARGVGMIYKHVLSLNKSGDINRPWTNPERGFIVTFTISSFGVE